MKMGGKYYVLPMHYAQNKGGFMLNCKSKKIENLEKEIESLRGRMQRERVVFEQVENYYKTAHVVTIKEIAMISKKGKIKWKQYKDISENVVSIDGEDYKQSAVQGLEVRERQIIEYDGIKPAYHSDNRLSYLAEYYSAAGLPEFLARDSPTLRNIEIVSHK